MKNSFFNRFVPKQPKFFSLLEQLANVLEEAAGILAESMEHVTPQEREAYYKRIKEV